MMSASNHTNHQSPLQATQQHLDTHILLPKCLEMIGSDTKSAELRVAYDAPTNQTTYQYSIVWEDANQGTEEKYKVAITEANKIMLALKAKKLKKCEGMYHEKKTCNERHGKTLEDEMIEKQDQGCPFPPDLRSRSEQREKPQEPINNIATTSDSHFTTHNSEHDVSKPKKSEKKNSRPTRSAKKQERKLTTLGCLDKMQKVTVKVFVIESPSMHGKLRPIDCVEATMETEIKDVLKDVLRENYTGIPTERLIQSASVLFAFLDKNDRQKMRRIRQSDIDTLQINNLPTFRGSVVLILDLIGFIAKGIKVQLQIDTDED